MVSNPDLKLLALNMVMFLTFDSVFYKLCLRAFPNHFKGNSVYAHYPMTIPR